MQVNTGGGLQNSKQNVPYCRNAVRAGASPHPSHCTDSPNNGLFFSFLIVFYSKKRQHTDRLQRINNIEEINPPKKQRNPKFFHPSDTFSIVPTGEFCRSLRLAGRERSGGHAGRRVT